MGVGRRWKLRRRAASLALLISTSCFVDRDPEHAAPVAPAAPLVEPELAVSSAVEAPPRHQPTAVLVVIDGARWQEIFRGTDPVLAARQGVEAIPAPRLMPNLYALVARGVALGAPGHGEAIAASGPHFVSLPGYTEILTGRSPSGCADNECGAPDAPTLLDLVRDQDRDAALFASWHKVGGVASARGDENDAHDEYRPDALTAKVTLERLRSAPPAFLFVAMGDADECAHQGDYRCYVEALRGADRLLGAMAEALGDRAAETTWIVTADHGRGRDWRHHGREFPESARVWLVAAGPRVARRGFVSSRRAHRLADVAPTLRVVLGLEADDAFGAGAPLRELLD